MHRRPRAAWLWPAQSARGHFLPAATAKTTMTSGCVAITVTGVRSRTASYGNLVISVALIACEGLTSTMVWPSGDALATRSMPMVMPAPGRLSTTTCWPHAVEYLVPSARASGSEPPPVAVGTMKRIGLVGKVCSAACAVMATLQAVTTAMVFSIWNSLLCEEVKIKPSRPASPVNPLRRACAAAAPSAENGCACFCAATPRAQSNTTVRRDGCRA